MLRCVLTTSLLLFAAESVSAEEPVALTFERLGDDAELALVGGHSRAQLIVTAEYSDQNLQDVTRDCDYRVSDPAVVAVSDAGILKPLADGTAIITAAIGSVSADIPIQVSGVSNPRPIHFGNQVVPVFTRLGCNGGGCHGKSGGQNGFRLSLLGFHPEEDFEYLRKEARGRRIFPGRPEDSLLLKKATGQTPHGGGRRMSVDSSEYALLTEWIRQGMPFGDADAPTVASID